MDGVIRTEALSKRYGNVLALTRLDLEVPRHSIFGLLGPNGSGKSTLMKLLLGLVRPSSGRASVFGLDVAQSSVAIRSRVGFLAQEPRFYGHLSARETLRFVLRFFDAVPTTEHERRVAEALAVVGLERKADRPVRGFSGGERQRLGIAQAAVHAPDLIILDEPAAALDPMGRSDVLAILRQLRDRATVVYSTHILDDVQRVSDRVAILDAGRLVAHAPVADLLAARQGTSYRLVLAGASPELRRELQALPWVSSIASTPAAGEREEGQLAAWTVVATDAAAAESGLLRHVLRDPAVSVKEFGRVAVALEDVFLELVGGDGDA